MDGLPVAGVVPLLLLRALAGPVPGPCPQPDLPAIARCATVEVFEDRQAASGRRIPLAVVVLPATGSPRAADAVFFIAGGPGQAATRSAASVAEEYAATRRTRDVVLVDQRGTGGSNGLPCVPFPATDIRLYLGMPGPEEVRRCRDALSARADLRFYSTEAAVEDLEDVRRALGYERVTLDAGSYGTKVALRYLARFPRRTRAAVLRAVNPPGFRIPLPFAAAGQAALDRLIEDCGRDPGCLRAFPDLRGDLAKVLARLDAGPVPVKVTNPGTGQIEATTLERGTYVARLHLLLFSSRLASRIPLLVHTAAEGDFSPFAELSVAFGKAIADQIDWGMQLSVLCTEDLPLISREEAERETRGTFLGPGRILAAQEHCASWPRGTLPPDHGKPVRSDVPVLLISGGIDPATPARYAEDAARTLSRSRLVVIPNGSHVDGGPCVDAIATAFIAAGNANGLDTSCVEAIRRPEWLLR
jgi:pimeloyl-ACP methyl ester carboxylesterase